MPVTDGSRLPVGRRPADLSAPELALRFEDAGAAAIIFTDIGRDGDLSGPNVEATAALAKGLSTPVIASGGVSSVEDLLALQEFEADGIIGAISGRALYDGRIELAAALSALSKRETETAAC